MGIGTSQTWENLNNGSYWLGDEASLAAGTSNLIAADGHHALSNLASVRLNDGFLQEAIISPTITLGIRKELTELDVAFLTDLGYEMAAAPVPEPSVILLLVGAAFLVLPRRKR
ncbi:MAG: PEP-CTERM sorting domain-containing protein [Akkermansiaceae bacterium]